MACQSRVLAFRRQRQGVGSSSLCSVSSSRNMKLSQNIFKNMLCYRVSSTHITLIIWHVHLPQGVGVCPRLAARRERRAIFAKSNVSSHQAVETRLDKSSKRNRNTGKKALKIPGQSGEPGAQFHLALGRASCFSVFSLFSWSPSSEFVSQI